MVEEDSGFFSISGLFVRSIENFYLIVVAAERLVVDIVVDHSEFAVGAETVITC